MALYDRLLGIEVPKLPVHQFMAVVAERQRGKITTLQAGDLLGLSASERTEIAALVARTSGQNALTPVEIHDVLLMGEFGMAPYNTVAGVKTRFGV